MGQPSGWRSRWRSGSAFGVARGRSGSLGVTGVTGVTGTIGVTGLGESEVASFETSTFTVDDGWMCGSVCPGAVWLVRHREPNVIYTFSGLCPYLK